MKLVTRENMRAAAARMSRDKGMGMIDSLKAVANGVAKLKRLMILKKYVDWADLKTPDTDDPSIDQEQMDVIKDIMNKKPFWRVIGIHPLHMLTLLEPCMYRKFKEHHGINDDKLTMRYIFLLTEREWNSISDVRNKNVAMAADNENPRRLRCN